MRFTPPSSRAPVLAGDVVATSQPLAAQAGLDLLARGGNAVDAALAAAIALTVVEPTSNGIGSDAFALVWDGAALSGLNASGRSPASWRSERFARRSEMPDQGWDSVTVPGAVSAWVALSERFGALPFEALFEPALRYARQGFLVSPWTAEAWARAAERLGQRPDFAACFLPGGRSPRAGERFSSLEMALSLERIAETKGAALYEGELAERMVAHAQREGGALTAEDLGRHQADFVAPLTTRYRDVELCELPPNGQGLAALVALGVLEHLDEDIDPDSARGVHLMVEAMKVGLSDVARHVGDPAAMRISPEDLLSSSYLATMAESIDDERAFEPRALPPRHGGTVLVVAADKSGRACSFLQSNYMGFGSGVVVPGTGISLQNRGAGFTLEPGHPNVVAGSKRPFHTILPGMALQGGRPLLCFGVMGGPMQPQGHVQMVVRVVGRGDDPQTAIDAPRWRLLDGRRLWLEPGFSDAVIDGLRARGHDVVVAERRSVAFGGAQAIVAVDEGWCAGSDGRRDGQAVGR